MPNVSTSYDVFLSHNSEDKPAVEALALRLREAGIEPFLDKWYLVPGQPWQPALEDALKASPAIAVFIGQRLGPWHHQEMQAALASAVQNQKPVIPVLLPGVDRAEVPTFLGLRTWVDLGEDDGSLRVLIAGIRGEAPGPPGGPAPAQAAGGRTTPSSSPGSAAAAPPPRTAPPWLTEDDHKALTQIGASLWSARTDHLASAGLNVANLDHRGSPAAVASQDIRLLAKQKSPSGLRKYLEYIVERSPSEDDQTTARRVLGRVLEPP